MRGVVLDGWAVLALLRGERPAQATVLAWVRRAMGGRFEVQVNLVNLGEVLYRLVQLVGRDEGHARLARLRQAPITIVAPREPLVFDAAEVKAEYPVSYADAIAVATARHARLPIATGDPEILALPRSVVRVRRLSREARRA